MHVLLLPAPVPIYIHVHMVRTDNIRTERVNEEILQGRNLFPCNKFISTCNIMCIDFVVMTCIIMHCRTQRRLDMK